MKTKNELKNVAAMLADNVVSVTACYSLAGRMYTFKATREFAQTLRKDDAVIASSNKSEMPFAVVFVVAVGNDCILEEGANINYCWLFQKVDNALYAEITESENQFVDDLYEAQKRSLRDKMLNALTLSENDREKFKQVTIGATAFTENTEKGSDDE